MIHTSNYASPLGGIILAARDDALIGLWFEGQKHFFASVDEPTVKSDAPILLEARAWLDRYFAGERPAVGALSLSPDGSEFRRSVWHILCEIPYGETITYGEIAQRLASEAKGQCVSAQAVGGAVAHNPISIIIPCHRVVGKNGSLTGYAGGIDRKLRLLRHEGADTNALFVPKTSTAP